MIILSNDKKIVNPSEVEGLSIQELALLATDSLVPVPFVMPRMRHNKNIADSITKQKQIYKVGFLTEVFTIVFKDSKKTRKEIFDYIDRKYDLFIMFRQYERILKIYNEKKNYIFVS